MKTIIYSFGFILILLITISCAGDINIFSCTNHSTSFPVYFGGYSAQGISRSTFNIKTGELTEPISVAQAENPSFLVIHPQNGMLYSVAEAYPAGKVKAFQIANDSSLTFINEQSSGGAGPCHLSFDKSNNFLLVANYGSGSASVIPIQDDGSLDAPVSTVQHEGSSIVRGRQEAPHAHSINISPDNQYIYVADLGIDKIMIYQFDDQTGELIENDPPYVAMTPGSGPRHFTFSPNRKFAYVINELNGTITAFLYDESNGNLSEIQTISTLPEDYNEKNGCAEIRIHANGKFLYGSNRGFNSIAVYQIDSEKGTLSFVEWETETVNWPRHFNIDPSGKYCLVANQNSNSVSVFEIDQQTGVLTCTGNSVNIAMPTCIQF